MLNETQLQSYENDGYLRLHRFLDGREVEHLNTEMQRLIDRAPVSTADASEPNPAGSSGGYSFTALADGRKILNRISYQLAKSGVMLRAYGNPKLLGTVQDIYGPDFVPFAESIVIKMPENGAAFAWHQDGNFKTGPVPERGVNFGIYLNPSTEQNGCLHVIPGTHRQGKVDIDSLVVEDARQEGAMKSETPILRGLIPVPAESGDLLIHSRNLVHGSFPNESRDLRVTVYFGFHALTTVEEIYPVEHIRLRMGAVLLAVRERQESGLYPEETPFRYLPRGVPSLEELDPPSILDATALSV